MGTIVGVHDAGSVRVTIVVTRGAHIDAVNPIANITRCTRASKGSNDILAIGLLVAVVSTSEAFIDVATVGPVGIATRRWWLVAWRAGT